MAFYEKPISCAYQKNAIVQCLDYQIPVNSKHRKGVGDVHPAKRRLHYLVITS